MESKKHWWRRAPGYRPPSDESIKDTAPRDIAAIRESLRKRNKRAFNRDRFSQHQALPLEKRLFSEETQSENLFHRDAPEWAERDRALFNLNFEKKKRKNRLSIERQNRIQRMRGRDARRGEKTERGPSQAERVRRINILLRAGVYDYDEVELQKLPDIVRVKMTRFSAEGRIEPYDLEVPKTDIEAWLNALEPYERERLYVLGRKKIDFKFRPDEFLKEYFKRYPKNIIQDEDSVEERVRKEIIIQKAIEDEKVFQAEQKQLADALEIVALPMLIGVFKSLGKNVDVYLTAANDDIAGGLDIVIELKKRDGSSHRFRKNGKPMRFVIDITYARMKHKLQKDLDRGRVSEEAFTILKGPNKVVPFSLSNARAMKLFRSMVETLGGSMSTLTFDKRGPLAKPQEHIPRLIVGLDWMSAFSEIGNWVEEGDSFEDTFRDSPLARRIAQSIETQLRGLHALTTRDKNNPNAPYLEQILRTMDFTIDKQRGIADDRSLENIDRLIASDDEPLGADLRKRLYNAALAQVAHDTRSGRRGRRDVFTKRPALQVREQAGLIEEARPSTEEHGPVLEEVSLLPDELNQNTQITELELIRVHLADVRKIDEIKRILELQNRIQEMERKRSS